jgi:site-specific recombinase
MRDSVEALLGRLAVDRGLDTVDALVDMIAWVRPERADDSQAAMRRLEELSAALREREDLRDLIRARIVDWFFAARQVPLYTEVGILSTQGFRAEFGRRCYERLLPAVPDRGDLKDGLALVFGKASDALWVAAIEPGAWLQLFEALDLFGDPERGERAGPGSSTRAVARSGLIDSVEVLSLRLAAQGLEPELLRIDPALGRFESPYIAQQRELSVFLGRFDAWVYDRSAEHYDDKHARVLLDQCAAATARVRSIAGRRGTSVDLTYSLVRMDQMVRRLGELLSLLDPVDPRARRRAALALLQELLFATARRNSLTMIWQDNIGLLARRVTENASRAGEHYVSNSRAEWLWMLRSAMGAGLIVGFMALAKLWAKDLHAPPLVETVLVCLEYSVGFVLIHMLHMTLATKQPAMTAATIAATVEETAQSGPRGKGDVSALAELIVRVVRTQFIAVVGNVAVAIPVAFLIGWAALWLHGEPLLGEGKAAHMVAELRPFSGYAVFHAALAGLWLFVAGLISGYYDNRCAYLDIPGRLREHPLLKALLPARWRDRMANYIDGNLGALAGNFSLGFLLGLTGFLGFLLGLPLDVRHVTLSSANFGLAVSSTSVPLGVFAATIGFVAIVGSVNLLVSFALALYVALKARGASFYRIGPLVAALLGIARRRPLDYFFPPPDKETPQ